MLVHLSFNVLHGGALRRDRKELVVETFSWSLVTALDQFNKLLLTCVIKIGIVWEEASNKPIDLLIVTLLPGARECAKNTLASNAHHHPPATVIGEVENFRPGRVDDDVRHALRNQSSRMGLLDLRGWTK
jgi:hypothetical protein